MGDLAFGLNITWMGMGLVFALLALLWLLLALIGRLDGPRARRLDPAPPEPPEASLPPDLLAAIAVAISLHRGARRPKDASAPPVSPSPWATAGRLRQTAPWT